MRRVLVTGPNGFIGRHCLPFLLEKGYEVHGIIPTDGLQLNIPNVQWHVGNLLNYDHIDSIMKKVKPSHLLHFAWYAKPGEFWTSAENLRWLQASLELFRAFKFYGGWRVLMAGTCAEYDWRYGYCSENITPLDPATLYGVCKKTLYEVLMSFAQLGDLSVAWGRIFFLYGPNEYLSRLVPSVINALLEKRTAPCTHGNQIRDFMYVEDVASAFAALLDSDIVGAVNIASGKPVALKTLICQIAERLDGKDLIQFGAIPSPEDEPPFLGADINRLKHELGWTPAFSLDTGLDSTINWWSRQRLLASK